MNRIVSLCAASCMCLCLSSVNAEDWSRFRGPNGSGISTESTPTPTQWTPEQGVKWKVSLPGPGVSSPIVVGDRVFVTCYSGYGMSRQDVGEIRELVRHLVCVNRLDGKILWRKDIPAVQPEDPYSGAGVPAHGYASHTPASDGKRVYAFFGKSGVFAFDMDGNQLWQKSLGMESDSRQWGSASSPIVYKQMLIVPATCESRALVALDCETGKEIWKQEAEGFDLSWSTPILVQASDEKTELVMGVPYELWAFNPETGKLAWYCRANDSDQFQSSVVADNSTVYAIEGRGGGSVAVKAGGKGDVSENAVVWSGNDSSRFASPIIYQSRLFYVSNGVLSCLDAKTGQRLSQARLPAADGGTPRGREASDPNNEIPTASQQPQQGQGFGGGGRGGFGGQGRRGFGRGFGSMDYASPVLANGKLYFLQGSGTMHVFNVAGEKIEHIASNPITTEQESFGGTPAISGGEIYVRSNKHLYCIGQ